MRSLNKRVKRKGKRLKLIITIPAYNEEKTIGNVIGDIKRVMSRPEKSKRYDYSILVVDDGSKDKTAVVAKKEGAIVYSHPRNYGLAETFRTEVSQCLKLGADVIVHTDADGQYSAIDIHKLLTKIDEGYALVLGSRFKGKIEGMAFINRIGNKVFSYVISSVTGVKISDGQTGFRAFTRELAEKLILTSNHTYTQEQIMRAVKEKYSVAEVPIYFARRKYGKSKLIKNPFEYALKAGVNIMRIYRDYQPIKFFGVFGFLFFGVGLLIGLWILYTLFTTGSVGALPRVMLSVLFLSIGVQIYLFGFLADMNRLR